MPDRSRLARLIIAAALSLLDPLPSTAGCLIPISCTLGQPCDDFNPFTFQERCVEQCDGTTCCENISGDAVTCECDLVCPSGSQCVNGTCLVQPPATSTPIPGPPTPTSTPPLTPIQGVEVRIEDARVSEADRDVFVSFVIRFSSALSQPTVLGLTVSAGSATQNVDYVLETGHGVTVTNSSATITFGSVTIPANTTASGNLGFRIIGDDFAEVNETFFVSLTVPPSMVGTDTSATGTIVNDDSFRVVGQLGQVDLAPQQVATRAGVPTLVRLTWTHPERWRDLSTIDLRLRREDGWVLWVRFDEAANTFALVDVYTGTPGPGAPPRSVAELAAEHATVLVQGCQWIEADADAPRVDVFYALRFAADSEGIYHLEASATDDTGAEQELETVGTIIVVPAPCPGDCNEDGAVRIDELVRGVTLQRSSVTECRAFDMTFDDAVAINELVAAVAAALGGCASAELTR